MNSQILNVCLISRNWFKLETCKYPVEFSELVGLAREDLFVGVGVCRGTETSETKEIFFSFHFQTKHV